MLFCNSTIKDTREYSNPNDLSYSSRWYIFLKLTVDLKKMQRLCWYWKLSAQHLSLIAIGCKYSCKDTEKENRRRRAQIQTHQKKTNKKKTSSSWHFDEKSLVNSICWHFKGKKVTFCWRSESCHQQMETHVLSVCLFSSSTGWIIYCNTLLYRWSFRQWLI